MRPSPATAWPEQRAGPAPVGAATRAALAPPTPLGLRSVPIVRTRSSLSISRVVPNRTASDSSAGPSTSSSSWSVAIGDGDVVDVGERSGVDRSRIASRSRVGAAFAGRSTVARGQQGVTEHRRRGALARQRWTFRDDSASPSGSRTSGRR